MNHEGYSYKFNGGVRRGIRYLLCKTSYCKGSAKILDDGTINIIVQHTHGPNDESFKRDELVKNFRNSVVERSKKESKALRLIYDEESIRNEEAAELYPWPVAESSMRQARRKVIPPLPPTLNALADYLIMNPERYMCCEESFFIDSIVDDNGKCSILFGCTDLIRQAVQQSSSMGIHADSTFKIVPSRPYMQVPQNINEFITENRQDLCIVCWDNPRSHALDPCWHRVLCGNCVDELLVKRCPMCNQNFVNAVHIINVSIFVSQKQRLQNSFSGS